MGNHAYKKSMAAMHNSARESRLIKEAQRAADKKANPDKYRASSRVCKMLQTYMAVALPITSAEPLNTQKRSRKPEASRIFALPYGQEGGESKPTLITDWDELAKLPPSDTHRLEIDTEYCNGWIAPLDEADTGSFDATSDKVYLSTHTFYWGSHEYSTKVLRESGFNVTIANWDEK